MSGMIRTAVKGALAGGLVLFIWAIFDLLASGFLAALAMARIIK